MIDFLASLTLFFTTVYLFTHPQYLMTLFFYGLKAFFIGYQKISSCCSRVSLLKKKTKRRLLLKTQTYDERPIMKMPNLSTVTKRKF